MNCLNQTLLSVKWFESLCIKAKVLPLGQLNSQQISQMYTHKTAKLQSPVKKYFLFVVRWQHHVMFQLVLIGTAIASSCCSKQAKLKQDCANTMFQNPKLCDCTHRAQISTTDTDPTSQRFLTDFLTNSHNKINWQVVYVTFVPIYNHRHSHVIHTNIQTL